VNPHKAMMGGGHGNHLTHLGGMGRAYACSNRSRKRGRATASGGRCWPTTTSPSRSSPGRTRNRLPTQGTVRCL
jgi:hypothetical protein